jgi:hypothetical protein
MFWRAFVHVLCGFKAKFSENIRLFTIFLAQNAEFSDKQDKSTSPMCVIDQRHNFQEWTHEFKAAWEEFSMKYLAKSHHFEFQTISRNSTKYREILNMASSFLAILSITMQKTRRNSINTKKFTWNFTLMQSKQKKQYAQACAYVCAYNLYGMRRPAHMYAHTAEP